MYADGPTVRFPFSSVLSPPTGFFQSQVVREQLYQPQLCNRVLVNYSNPWIEDIVLQMLDCFFFKGFLINLFYLSCEMPMASFYWGNIYIGNLSAVFPLRKSIRINPANDLLWEMSPILNKEPAAV